MTHNPKETLRPDYLMRGAAMHMFYSGCSPQEALRRAKATHRLWAAAEKMAKRMKRMPTRKEINSVTDLIKARNENIKFQ